MNFKVCGVLSVMLSIFGVAGGDGFANSFDTLSVFNILPVFSQQDTQVWLFVGLCLLGFLWLISAVLRVLFCTSLQSRIGSAFDVWTVVISFFFLVALFIYIFKYGGAAY